MREILYPFDQEKFPGEFCFVYTFQSSFYLRDLWSMYQET